MHTASSLASANQDDVGALPWLARQGAGRRALLAFGCGSLGALAYPPIGFVPVFWRIFPVLIRLLGIARTDWQAALTGWCFAFGFFVFNLYWIAASMFVDIAQFWWAVPFAVAGLPAFLSIYYGLAAVAARRIGLGNLSGIMFFALLWLLADYARGHLFGGFPWSLEAYAWDRVLPVLQITSAIGAYGLSLITVLLASMPVLWRRGDRKAQAVVMGSLCVLLAIFVWGEVRLSQDTNEALPNIRVRLVQPNVQQADKWKEGRIEEGFQQLLDLSSAPPVQAGDKVPTHIIWPETASTFYLTTDMPHRMKLAAQMAPDSVVMTGVIRVDRAEDGKARFYNSLIAIDDAGQVVAHYDKAHLVPYGEYMPMRKILPIHALISLPQDFSSGPGPVSLRVPGMPAFSPFICYEAVFPDALVDRADRPGVLVNITNDGWYGNTTGPYQHFGIARVRAIEEGLPLLRAANTGVSGAIDAYGRITTRLGLARTGFIDTDIGAALPITVFGRFGDTALYLLCAILGFAALMLRIMQKQR